MADLPVLDTKDFSPAVSTKTVLNPNDFSRPPVPGWGEVARQALGNLIPSTVNMGETMVQPFLHPLDTAKAIGTEAMHPVTAFQSLRDTLWNKYGTVDRLKESLAKDPAGTLSDLALSLFPSTGGIGSVARKTDPAGILAKAPGAIGKGVKGIARHEVGYMSGVGPWAVGKAMEGSPEFLKGQAGGSEMEMIRHAKEALRSIKAERQAEYAKRLEDISNRTIPVQRTALGSGGPSMTLEPIQMDLSPIHSKLHDLMRDFRIDANGNSFPGGSYIAPEHRPAVAYMIKRAGGHGVSPEERTPVSVDMLKRDIRGAIPYEGSANAFGNALHSVIRDTLEKQVPGYRKMTSDYADKTRWIKEMEKGLSLGDNSTADTAMRKLLTGVKELPDFRRGLVEQLDRASPGFADRLAGYQMKEWAPRMAGGRQLLGAEAMGGLTAALLNHPLVAAPILGTMATSSPKLMGMVLNVLGREAKRMKFLKKISVPPQAVYRAGQVKKSQENPQ